MLHAVGLLTAGNEALIPYAIRMIKQRHIDFGFSRISRKPFRGIAKSILWAFGTP
jgi:hypothetical protein